MKKLILAPIALSLLTLAGCGEDGDAIFGSGSNDNNEFTVSSFDRSSNAIARIDETFSTGERDIKVQNVVGSYDTQRINSLESSVVLADRFEGTLEDQYIEVNGRTVERPVYEKDSNNQFNYETTYRTLSLSGVDAGDYTASNNFGSSRGILTDLNNYPKIPSNLSFPNGSVCYIPVTTSDRSFFTFNDKDKTGYQTLDKWTDNAEERFSDNRQSSTIKLNIGSNNNQQAVQVKFFAINNDPEYLYNGIDYDDSIYDADFIDSDNNQPNEDSIRGVVDCTFVNDVAADFLAEQIDFYY